MRAPRETIFTRRLAPLGWSKVEPVVVKPRS
jgi:hypothetical protein